MPDNAYVDSDGRILFRLHPSGFNREQRRARSRTFRRILAAPARFFFERREGDYLERYDLLVEQHGDGKRTRESMFEAANTAGVL